MVAVTLSALAAIFEVSASFSAIRRSMLAIRLAISVSLVVTTFSSASTAIARAASVATRDSASSDCYCNRLIWRSISAKSNA